MLGAQETSGHQPGEELCNCEFSLAYGEKGLCVPQPIVELLPCMW